MIRFLSWNVRRLNDCDRRIRFKNVFEGLEL